MCNFKDIQDNSQALLVEAECKENQFFLDCHNKSKANCVFIE